MLHPDFNHAGSFYLKSLGYTIVDDPDTRDVWWVSSEGERCHLIISGKDRSDIREDEGKIIMPVVISKDGRHAVEMVNEAQKYNDDLRKKRDEEASILQKENLQKGVEKIKGMGLI